MQTPDVASPGSTYDDIPSPDFPTAPRDRDKELPTPARFGRSSEERDRERPPSGGARPRRSQDDQNPPLVGRRSDDPYAEPGPNEPLSDRDPYPPSRRKPSQDTTITTRSQQQDLGRRPSVASGTDSTSTNAQSATVTSGIIIPNKSTIAEEDIEVPYGRSESAPEDGDGEADEVESGLGSLARRLGQDPDTDGGARSDDYYDKMSFGRASVASDRSARVVGGRVSTAPNDDSEKMRRDYEFRIATMQNRIASLEREIEDGDVRAHQIEHSDQRMRQLEDDLDKFRRVSRVIILVLVLNSVLHSGPRNIVLQCWLSRRNSKTYVKMRSVHESGKHDARNKMRKSCRSNVNVATDWKKNVPRLYVQLLLHRLYLTRPQADSEVVEQLRSDMEALIVEVSDLSRRNDELMTSKDSDLSVIRDLDSQLKDYKRKYEQAKTELRSVKGMIAHSSPHFFALFSHSTSHFSPLPAKTQI